MGSFGIGGVDKALIEFLNIVDYERYDFTVYFDRAKIERELNINSNVNIKLFDSHADNMTESIKYQLGHFKIIQASRIIRKRLSERRNRVPWEIKRWNDGKKMPVLDEDYYDCAIAYRTDDIDIAIATLYRIQARKKIFWVHGKTLCEPASMWNRDSEYSKFDAICCVSKTAQMFFSILYPSAGDKTMVIHNFFNIQDIHVQAAKTIKEAMNTVSIVTVGRLSKEKGQNMIPKTARILLDKGFVFKWYLIGDGDLKTCIEKEIEHNQVKDYVILLGAKKNPYPYMKNCDIYVQTSFLEAHCLTVEEAKILGKPIVITPELSMMEQIRHAETGLIARNKTPEAIASCIGEMLESPLLCEKFIKNLQDEKYNNQEELQKLYDFIEC